MLHQKGEKVQVEWSEGARRREEAWESEEEGWRVKEDGSVKEDGRVREDGRGMGE